MLLKGFLPWILGLTKVLLYFFIFKATPAEYVSFQVRSLIRATTAGLHHSHRNMEAELCLRSTSQLTAMLDP